jgi:gliding motility-associated lipoprotein GldH
MKRLHCPFVLIITGLILTSCDPSRVYEENMKVTDQEWNKSEAMVFSPEIADSSLIYNVLVNVRNASSYSYSNLFLFITTTSPGGQWIKDTLEIPLADNRGKWLGSGIGDLYFNRQLFKYNVRFPYSGVYSFEIVHGMRDTGLKGIRDIGLRIEKSE